ncbi:hypothetical protein JTE90_005989 [Oedothorax gibbosus]|uniref:GTP-binding protein 10 n=1 Tax=Oedothorax gibbosus TaxID=931172 RepID=A0AAV6UYM9_9ARAC|nr:hypothetical protein JTE90_005989 [Oedothorax gibbosus]
MVRLTSLLLRDSGRRTFIDSVRIFVRGGRGGNGLPKYGGIGGKGGDVYAEAVENYSLKQLKKEFPSQRFVAGSGGDSRRFQILGSPGEDYIIKCPPGVTACSRNIIGDLNRVGDKILLSRGGAGGNPQNGYLGQKGQPVPLTLDLKLLADVGFVGYPNAGKSTLLKALSKAQPKIANYPFTTIAPNIGMLCYNDLRQISAADLPGLIEGAHVNFGMGHKFLKHCMRTKVLLFIVDIDGFQLNTTSPLRNAFETIVCLNKELELYDEDLLLKPAMLAVNKIDTDDGEAKFQKLKDEIKYLDFNIKRLPEEMRPKSVVKFDAIVPISAKEGTNVEVLKQKIRTIIDIYQEQNVVRYLEEGPKDMDDAGVIYV